MTQARVAGWVAVLCAAVAMPVFSGTVTLLEEALVKGLVVVLGDVADVQGDETGQLASLELAPAAAPGGFKNLDAGLLVARLKTAGLDPAQLEIKGARSVRATTLSLEVSPEMIVEDLRNFIYAQMPWNAEDASVDVTMPKGDVVVPDGDVLFRWSVDPTYRYLGPATFRGEILVDGKTVKTFLCKAVVSAHGEVAVAAKDIARGEPLSGSAVAFQKKPLSSMRGGLFPNPADLEGYVARTTIAAGEIVTRDKTTPRVLVKRNQTVTVEARAGTLCIRNRAKALSDGCAGDVIACLNVQSKEGFQGTVRKDGIVEVQ